MMFNYNKTLEENKHLFPVTIYQQYSSSFDGQFGSQKAVKTIATESGDSENRMWCPETECQKPNLEVSSLTFRSTNEIYDGGFHPDIHGETSGCSKNSNLILAGGGIGCSGENDRRNLEASNLLSVSPERQKVEDFMGEAIGTNATSQQSLNRNFQNEVSLNPPADTFGSSGCQTTPLATPTQNSSLASIFYPLVVTPLDGNTSLNIFNRTGHSRPMMCNFCKNNKEVPDIYLNHYLYDPNTKVLTCPVLRKHKCEICGSTGDKAHTLQYCPVNRERGLQAKVPVLLKTRTITNSTGKIRRN